MSSAPTEGRRQAYEARQANARNEVPKPRVPTQGELRAYVGAIAADRMGLTDSDATCDSAALRERYFSTGGLQRFLSEGFPFTTSLKPFGPGQIRSIEIAESVCRNGGIQQLLEPRGFTKSSRVARTALWATLAELRRCAVVFQSSATKSISTVQKIKNELAGSPFLMALVPHICTACKHATLNPGLTRRQHFGGELTNVQWLTDSIRLPDIMGEPGGGARLLAMPFAKAAGIALSDPVTLEDLRPDLLLPDDVQSHDDCSSPRISEKLLEIWNGSVKYLCGRGKTGATLFVQTVFAMEDMADQLSRDPSVHTVKYPFLIDFPTNKDWWEGDYKRTLLEYDEYDPEGQAKARAAANKLYRDNQDHADEGAKVSWDHAYDPDTAVSAIQVAMNNFLSNEQAFWAQDQNSPQSLVSEDDIRAKPKDIMAKVHGESKGVVPAWATKLVCHVDVHDSLLYYKVAAGSETMQLGMIDRQTWPPQKQQYFQLRNAHANFTTDARYRDLPTVGDKIRAALDDLVTQLNENTLFQTADGRQLRIDKIGIDCGDGDHLPAVHAFCSESRHANVVPMRGAGIKASQTPMNARPKGKNEKRRGDHWIERVSERTKSLWLEFDANYFKTRTHKGLRAPIGTSESISLFATKSEKIHHMSADHCNAEIPTWVVASRANEVSNGVYEWAAKPNCDNHRFDNLVGCLVLVNYCGGNWIDSKPAQKRKRKRVDPAEAQRRNRSRN